MPIVQQVNWILYLSTVGLRECKAAVLSLKLITIQMVCTYLPTPICAYTVGSFYSLRVHYAFGKLKKEAKASLFFFFPFGTMTTLPRRFTLSFLHIWPDE